MLDSGNAVDSMQKQVKGRPPENNGNQFIKGEQKKNKSTFDTMKGT